MFGLCAGLCQAGLALGALGLAPASILSQGALAQGTDGEFILFRTLTPSRKIFGVTKIKTLVLVVWSGPWS